MIAKLKLAWSEIPRTSYLIFAVGSLCLIPLAQSPVDKGVAALMNFMHIPIWIGFYYKAVEREKRGRNVAKTS